MQVEEVMSTQNVGPNGALVYCMELVEKNLSWLLEKIKSLTGHYLIFDFPGQVSQFPSKLYSVLSNAILVSC